jgi:dTDP-4-dehydrorhamnose reductase
VISEARPLLVTGATGTLGRAFARICEVRGLPYRLTSRREMEIAEPASVAVMLDELQPWAVINTAGYVRVDDAEREPAACERENMTGPLVLADACAARGLPLVTFSSDLVFDGRKREPFVESDPVAPLNVYGRTKAEAETRVLAAHPAALVIRTSAFIGPWDDYNFVTVCLRELSSGRAFVAAADSTVSPTYVPDLVNVTLDLLIDGERGIWHLANEGETTWADLARDAATMAGVDAARLEAVPIAALDLPAPRPAYSALTSERGRLMPSLEDALRRYFEERPPR